MKSKSGAGTMEASATVRVGKGLEGLGGGTELRGGVRRRTRTTWSCGRMQETAGPLHSTGRAPSTARLGVLGHLRVRENGPWR